MAVAVITESHPLFPDFYYTDARLIDGYAWEFARTGHSPLATPNIRTHAALIGLIYRIVGHAPFAAKTVSCVAGAAAVVALGAMLFLALGESGWFAAWVAALWPSQVFFTSQIFKDPWVLMLSWSALLCATAALRRADFRAAWLAAPLLIAVGLFRPYLLAVEATVVAACAFYVAARAQGRAERLAAGGLCAATLMTCVVFHALNVYVYRGPLSPVDPPPGTEAVLLQQAALVPSAFDYGRTAHAPLVIAPISPQSIARFRAIRHEADRALAAKEGRLVESQILPDARMERWRDVAAFLPRGAFYALFMPLPGLYPLNGKLGRALACAENLVLLALALAAAARLRRAPWNPAAVMLIAFFAVMTVGSGLFEFDLGSATRHRLAYLPFLLAFAFAPARRGKAN